MDYLVRNTCVEFEQIAECNSIAAILLKNTKRMDYAAQFNDLTTDVYTSLLATQFCL